MEVATTKGLGFSSGGWQCGLVRASNQLKALRLVRPGQRIQFRPPCSVTPRKTPKKGDPTSRQFCNLRCSRTSRGALPSSTAKRTPAIHVETSTSLSSTNSTVGDGNDWNLEGWRVVLKDTGEEVGFVEEVLGIGCTSAGASAVYEYFMLKVVDSNSPGIEVLVPWVEDIVKEVDSSSQCVLIKPPDGLLELARRPEVLRKIRIALKDFGLHTEGQVEPHMPTRRQLQGAGEHKLVEMIMAAGGFPSVAQALGFYSKRRPVGFWEDLQNVDTEIEAFVGESWREETDPKTGASCYVNRVTHEVLHEKPPATSVMNPIPVSQVSSDSGTAVMPRMRTVKEAGRYDLHHAIMMHGGYKDVAQQLGRQAVCRNTVTNLEMEIMEFMQEHRLSMFPTPAELQAQNRADLAMALRKNGGFSAVARSMGLRMQRNGKGHWASVEEAAEAMKEYMVEKLLDDRPGGSRSDNMRECGEAVWAEALQGGSLRLPTQVTILADGRRDLRYVLQKFGQQAIADQLGIKDLTMRRPRLRRP